MNKHFNIHSFSKEIGYSVATVSRALNSQTAHMVKQETRDKIQTLADEFNFIPHPGARVLRRTRPAPLAVLLVQRKDIALSEYYSRLLMGILEETSKRQQAVHAMAFNVKGADFLEELNSATIGCDGIIYLSDPLERQAIAQTKRIRQPFVGISGILPVEQEEDSRAFPAFGVDDVKGGKIATEHLISLGHRKIAFLNGPATNHDAQKRLIGYRAALEANGIDFDPTLCIETVFDLKAGIHAAEKFLPLMKSITAVVCGSDELALGLMAGLAREGIDCPKDVSITGYDDLRWSSLFAPSLTTVSQPFRQMAKASVEMVAGMHAFRKGKGTVVKDRIFKPKLLIRDSTQKI